MTESGKPRFVFPDPSKPVGVWWPVTVLVPADSADADEGLRQEQAFNVRFVVAADDKVIELLKKGGDVELLSHVVVDWRIKDESGEAVPFERFGELVLIPYVQDGLIAAYRDFIGRAPTKN